MKCACRSTDPEMCIRLRYDIDLEDECDERCECSCHDEEEE